MNSNSKDVETINLDGDETQNNGSQGSITAEEIELFRDFISKQQKKKEAAENRRRKSKSNSTSSPDKSTPSKKPKTHEKKIIKNSTETQANDGEIKQMSDKEKKDDDELHQAILNYEGDFSESEDDNPMGSNESVSKKMRIEKNYHKRFTVPAALIDRAQLLKHQRQGIFVYQCESCREKQKKREYYLFSTGIDGLSVLTIELCAEDLDKNISLGMHYSGYFGKIKIFTKIKNILGHSNNGHQSGSKMSMLDLDDDEFEFTRGASITKGTDKKLLNLGKYCWILHQCAQCSDLSKKLANELFIKKKGSIYELSFPMDQQMYEHVIEGLKESVIRFSRQISTLEYVRQDDKMLKNELYDAFMQFHEKRYPLAKCQIHEYLLREMNALAKIAITEVVKDELYFELHNPFSKFGGQIDLEMAIKIFNKHGSIHGPIMREG
uniref:Uncharacterized protein n=1 Tax=Meloidogyne enterolobii TaxID=390850 RepID=A0A6V7URP5_MELEN|nr:unnamed protein product [Meloidogyne enterolobii]